MRTRTCGTIALACVAFLGLTKMSPWQATAQPAANPLLDVVITSTPPLDEVDDLQPGQNPIDFFDAYSWKIFVALNWPNSMGQRGVPDTSKSIDDSTTPRVWETWKAVEETFLPGGAPPTAWTGPNTPSLCRNAAALGAAPAKLLADLNQGDDNGGSVGPLIAQNRTYVRYEIRFNKLEFDSIFDRKLFIRSNISSATARLPDGVIDIKAAWRELKPGESAARYYKTDALAMDPITGNCDVRSFVMIGFHIGQKTPKRPQWIWSTFEHVDNLTVGPEVPTGTKPSLNDVSKPQTLGDQPDPIDAMHPLKADPDPVQVVLESPLNRIPPETAATNAKWHADPRIKGSFLRFYQLVRTQWPTLVPPNPVGAGSPFPSQRVANMTMETYLQGSSCIGCHFKTTLNTDFVWAINNRAFPIKNNLLSNAKVLNDQAKKSPPMNSRWRKIMPITFEVFPAIGIARVGNSADHFVFDGAGSFNSPRRDSAGALLRQAAEFRVYRCSRDDAGNLLAADEMDASKASIDWTIQLANRKAAGKQFLGNGRRNNSTGNDAQDAPFIIDTGPQVLAGVGQSRVLQGAFMGQAVKLGDAMTVLTGRLLVLGGDGSAASPTNRPITNFADNDGWFDTVSDGVVFARVTPNGGQSVDALAAWVLVAPPDYAPPISNLVTMYDVLVDLAVSRSLLAPPDPVVFSRHVRPILERGMDYQWVNMAARMGYADSLSGGHSSGGPGDFSAKLAQLGDPALSNQPRARIFRRLRDPDSAALPAANQNGMPRLNDDAETGDVFSLTRTQYQALLKWSHGQFVTNDPAPVTDLEPDRLTRVALESCSGGPFFPGIEAGRIMRDVSRYMQGQAFRLSPDHVKPGEITQGNAVPWQADFQLCRWEESDGGGSLRRLAWWPAQRPDDVLTTINNPPVPWARGIPDTFLGMLANWHRLGFVKADPANPGSFIEQDRDRTLPP